MATSCYRIAAAFIWQWKRFKASLSLIFRLVIVLEGLLTV